MNMNFKKDTKFFFTDFHTGTVNIILHIITAIVFVIGITNRNLFLSIIGLAVIDELGHIYNYFILHKRDPLYTPVRMIPYQQLYVIPPALIVFFLFGVI